MKADLQWYDGKVWRHSTYVPLTKGKGTFSFKAAGRGTTRSWRVIVPKMTMNGLPIVATTSGTFRPPSGERRHCLPFEGWMLTRR